ncbi:MAG: CPBP family glutamic-type intramembrane protease [Nitrososphaerota archaeon]|nr:CPBP family glutamic-type intramembrane protease [Candidatus Bathyarchaeota archaeon]MCX8162209.1 CPBP family glutamic-type intramembrane protease [Candidatus Bathyarchaeota archaeon]MDW8062224.1 CPBP family glutamic-type intramembrane protease [Nitrososphaerota archaeon]
MHASIATEDKSITCSRCGASVDILEASFCPICGAPLRKDREDITWSISDVFKVLLLSFLLFILSIIAIATLTYTILFGVDLFGSFLTSFPLFSLFHVLLLSFTLFYLKRRGGSLKSIGLKKIDRKTVAIGIVSGLIIVMVNILIGMLLQPIIGASPIQEEVYRLISRPGMRVSMAIFSVIVAPFVEEVYFRGFSYQAFRKSWGVKMAVPLCSMFFSILHMDPWSIPNMFIAGVILTLIYERTMNLNATVIAHSINNLSAILIYLTYTS